MKTSIATVWLSGALAEKLEAIAAAGFDRRRDFRERSPVVQRHARATSRRMVRDLGLEIITFQPFRDFEGMPEPQRSRALTAPSASST